MPKSNMCGHIMPTNNLKQVFLPKSIGKNRTCEKTIIVCFIWSDGVHTVCVYELYIVLSHCAQVGSIAEASLAKTTFRQSGWQMQHQVGIWCLTKRTFTQGLMDRKAQRLKDGSTSKIH